MCTRVLASLALLVGVAHCFSWDIVLAGDKRLEFLNNGTLEHIEGIPVIKFITAFTYDSVHNRVLFADRQNTNSSIYSFDIPTHKIQHIVTKITDQQEISSLAYDPVTQILFWKEQGWMDINYEIYSLSLKPASSDQAVEGKLLVKLNSKCGHNNIAVESCGGFIYWSTDIEIARATFDGSKREILVNDHVFSRRSLAIDQQTQKMYWIEETSFKNYSIKSADLNGKNIRTFHFIGTEFTASSLTISKDFIYWWSFDQQAIVQLKKYHQHGAGPIVHPIPSVTHWFNLLMAAKYTVEDQTLGIQGCEALKNTSLDQDSMDLELTQEHATKVSAKCHAHSTTCHYYCVHGNCSISAEGQPKCSCEAGFSGERCELNACYKHCLNSGVCSLSEEGEPVCECPADYEGDRCHVATTKTDVCVCADKIKQQILIKVQQAREDLQTTLQLYSDKLDESAAKIQICEESKKDNLQNLNETTIKTQT